MDSDDEATPGVVVHRLVQGPVALRARMGEAGRALVLKEFSTEVMCAGNLAIYRKVLGQ